LATASGLIIVKVLFVAILVNQNCCKSTAN